MATSGYTSIVATKHDTLKFSWWENSQSIENNSTNIGWKMELITDAYGRINSSSKKSWSVNVNGTAYSGTNYIGIGNNETKTLASGTTTIGHNSDGQKTFTYSFSQLFDITFSDGYIGTKSGSGTGTLDAIARASQPSCVTYPNHTQNVGSFGETISIHMNRLSSAFTHKVRYAFGSLSGTCIDADTGKAATSVGTGFKWKIPESFMDLLPASTSGSGTIYVDTYNGSTLVGTKYCGFTATVPTSVKPSCTFTLDDVTDIDKTYGSPVKGLSKIQVVVTATIAYSSPIATYCIEANGTKYWSSTATTGALLTAGTSRVKVTVTDKRGRTGTNYYDMNVQDYVAPAVTSIAVHRCNSDGTENDRGEYIKATFSATVSSMGNKNNATYKLGYKKTSANSYTTVTLSELVNNFAVTDQTYIFAADGNSSYDVQVTVADRHKTTTRNTSASTAFTLINYHADGNAIRFGGAAEIANAFQNDLTFIQRANSYTYYSAATGGTSGYIRVAEITITGTYMNYPIVFELVQRDAKTPMVVNILFESLNGTQPGLQTIWYEGSNYEAYLSETSASVWGLYVKKSQTWDSVTVSRWYAGGNITNSISVTFPGDQVSTVPTGLKGYYRATPAILRSIIDCLLPVGTIIQRYDHNDPNTMYPGTTWVRIYGAFPWYTDANGQIGLTGGERTVTLTENQIPSHTHRIRWTGSNGTATGGTSQENPLVRYGTTGTGYTGIETLASGGGEAHNNMPPYIQISAWRRTA